MKPFNRRSFLKSMLYGIGLSALGTLPATHLLATPTTSLSPKNSKKEFLKEFEKARIHFLKKEYKDAEIIYRKLLSEIPTDISAYDNFKKVLGVQHCTLEILPYYKKAIEKYPRRVDFYDRLEKTLREIATGNKKLEKELQKTEGDLLSASVDWYKKAIQKDSSKKFLYFGLLDTLDAVSGTRSISPMSRNALSVLPAMTDEEQQLTAPYLQEWMARKKPEIYSTKARAFSLPAISAQDRLSSILDKDRRPLYTLEEQESRTRELIKVTKTIKTEQYQQLYVQKDFEKLTTLAIEVLHDDVNETQMLGETRACLVKEKKWDLLVQLYENRANSYKDFWTQYGLADAYLHRGEVAKGETIFSQLTEKFKYPNGKQVDVVYRGLSRSAIANGNVTLAKEYLLKGMEKVNGLGRVSLALLFAYADCLVKENNTKTAKELLRKKLDVDYSTDVSDPILKYIAPNLETNPEGYYMHQSYNKKIAMSKNDRISILCAIAKIQKIEQDTEGLNTTCAEIETLKPNYPFVRRIKSLS